MNRDIVKKDNLYQDRINMTLINAGKELKDIKEMILPPNRYNPTSGANLTPSAITTLMTPTPLTATEKLLQINLGIEAGSQVDRIILYKQVVRQVNS